MTWDELEDLLRSTCPQSPPLRNPDHPRLEGDGPVLLLHQREAMPVDVNFVTGAKRHMGARAVAAVAIAGCAAVAGGIAVAVVPGSQGRASAATVLDEAARHVVSSNSLGPGQYLYVQSATEASYLETSNGQRWHVDVPAIQETWSSTDGAGRFKVAPGAIAFPSVADRAAWVAAGSPSVGPDAEIDQTYMGASSLTPVDPTQSPEQQQATKASNEGMIAAERAAGGSGGAFTPAEISSLPTDPAALEQFLIDHYEGGQSDPLDTFSMGASLLVQGTSSAQQVAIFEMMSTLPGVTLQGAATTDVTDQRGTALSVSDSGGTRRIIIDPGTGTLLEQSYTFDPAQDSSSRSAPGSAADPGAVHAERLSGYTVYQSTRVVNSTANVEKASS